MPDPSGKPALKITSAERPNTIGLGQRELEILLSKLEAADNKSKVSARREFSRWPFRQATIKVTLIQPAGSEVVLKLACRNISRGGISLLHNQFVHPGSMVVVALPTLNGTVKEIVGTIKRCVHKKATLHELGVQFEEPVELRDYLGAGKGAEFYSLEAVDPEKLTGQVLYVEDSDIDFRVMQHFLRETGLSITRAMTAASGLEAAVNGFDLIIVDWQLPDMDGVRFVTKVREMAIETPCLIVTADPVALMRSGMLDAAVAGLLTKPLSQILLLRAIAERLLIKPLSARNADSSEGAKEDPNAPKNGKVAEIYVDLFGKLAETIEKAIADQDHPKILDKCKEVRGSAPSCGAPHLAKIADHVISTLEHPSGPTQGLRFAKELIVACRRLQAA